MQIGGIMGIAFMPYPCPNRWRRYAVGTGNCRIIEANIK